MTTTPTYVVKTLGCQMNVHDSERMAGLLEGAGYTAAPAGTDIADVVVINTCAVRENAANKLYASSIVPYVVGGVGLLAGATLMYFYLADDGKPTASSKPGQAHVTPWIGIASAGVRGTF